MKQLKIIEGEGGYIKTMDADGLNLLDFCIRSFTLSKNAGEKTVLSLTINVDEVCYKGPIDNIKLKQKFKDMEETKAEPIQFNVKPGDKIIFKSKNHLTAEASHGLRAELNAWRKRVGIKNEMLLIEGDIDINILTQEERSNVNDNNG